MKQAIPLIQIGRLPHKYLPAGHPDLPISTLRHFAADLDCTIGEAYKILLEITGEEYNQ